MRMSCNGCRVLRKGCSDNCSIRPCIQWIKSPEAQANATVFLAKFYGRAGLINLVTAGPEHLRPAIFRSLLYEACGRVVNPIYGSVGLLWSGNWKFCQDAVEAVLKGAPVVQIPSESAACPVPPLKAYDIRHVSKEDHSASQDLHRVKTRPRFKRSAAKSNPAAEPAAAEPAVVWNLGWRRCYPDGFERAASHDSTLSHQSESKADTRGEADSMGSMETMSHGGAGEPAGTDESAVELELTLGFDRHPSRPHASPVRDRCKMELGLDLPA